MNTKRNQTLVLTLYCLFTVSVLISGSTAAEHIVNEFRDQEELEYTHAQYSNDGSRLILYNLTSLKVWDALAGKEISSFRLPEPIQYYIRVAAISPDGKWIAVGGISPGLAVILDADTGEVVRELKYEIDPYQDLGAQNVMGIAFSLDGEYLFTNAEYPGLLFWDLKSGDFRKILGGGGRSQIKMFPDGKKLLYSAGMSFIITFPEGEVLNQFSANAPVIISEGKTIRSINGTAGGEIREFYIIDRDVDSGDIVRKYEPFKADMDRFEFTPNGELFIAYSDSVAQTITFRDVPTGNVLSRHEKVTSKPITAHAFSPDGKTIAVVYGNEVTIYDVAKSIATSVTGVETLTKE